MKHTLFLLLFATLFIACTSSNSLPPQYQKQIVPTPVPTPIAKPKVQPKQKDPRAKHEMQKVEVNNYTDTYMYPEDGKLAKKDPVAKVKAPDSNSTIPAPAPIASNSMGKEECISMMGEDKFAHYSKMFGSDAGAIKRCTMIKGMQ